MRSVQLARIAAQAELLQWRARARRQATRMALVAVAGVFVLAALVAAHALGALLLTRRLGAVEALLIVGGVDLLLAFAFALLAVRNVPGAMEREALLVREDATSQLMQDAALTTLAAPLLRLVGVRRVCGLALAALTARYLGSS